MGSVANPSWRRDRAAGDATTVALAIASLLMMSIGIVAWVWVAARDLEPLKPAPRPADIQGMRTRFFHCARGHRHACDGCRRGAASEAYTKPGPPRPRPRRSPKCGPLHAPRCRTDGRLRERLAEKLWRHQGGAHQPQRAARGGARRGRIGPTARAGGRKGRRAEARSRRPRRSRNTPTPPTGATRGRGRPGELGCHEARVRQCASGTRQSPIDIREGIKVQLDRALRLQAERLPRHRQRPHHRRSTSRRATASR